MLSSEAILIEEYGISIVQRKYTLLIIELWELLGEEMLYDKVVLKAVASIKQRSERQSSLEVASKTFVDPGILVELDNYNHQVIFGRRGTGKTHVLRKLQSDAIAEESKFACYIDCRVMGSSSQFLDDTLSIEHRSFSIFKDILSEIHDLIFNQIVDMDLENSDYVLAKLDKLSLEISAPKQKITSATITSTSANDSSKNESMGVGVALAGKIGFDLSSANKKGEAASETSEYKIEFSDKAVFRSISKLLSEILGSLGCNLLVLIDEWSSIPMGIQPYVSEFLKRAFLPCRNLTIKIAAIEFRSNFSLQDTINNIGVELGADISTAPTMDSFYHSREEIKKIERDFSEMLYKHISSELPFDYIRKRYHVSDGEGLMYAMFEEKSFGTLCQASEGVVRDLINIFIMAFSRLQKYSSYEQRTKINHTILYEASKNWFERDKLQGLSDSLKDRYLRIVQHAITKNKSKYFLVPVESKDKELLDKLVDLRVLHQSSDSFMSLVEGAGLYRVYNIDFGSYAAMIEFDNRTRHIDMPFFDQKGFSKYPALDEDPSKYMLEL